MPPSKVTLDNEVDDLDDVLEQFNVPPTRPVPVPPPSNSTSQAATKGTGPAPEVIIPEDIADEDAEFARQFAAEMEAFMQGLTNGGALSQVTDENSSSNSAAALPDHDELQKAWKKLLVEDLEADPASSLEGMSGLPGSSSGKPSASDSTAAEDTFQRAVKQAMEKLKESDDTIKADEAPGLESLLATLGLGEGGGGEGGEGDMQGILETLMSQLMSKDILYEPLNELNQKFPGYLEENASKLLSEDLERFKKQQAIVTEVVAIFEKPGYSDEDTTTSTEIVRLMSEMQTYGSPPSEIMGPLPPGMGVGPDGLPTQDCTIA